MKHLTKSKMITLISAILIVLIAAGFFIPYTLAYFESKERFGADAKAPIVMCEIVGNGFKSDPFTVNSTQMYVSVNSFSNANANNTSAVVKSYSNIKTLLRVKLTFKLSTTNTREPLLLLEPIQAQI